MKHFILHGKAADFFNSLSRSFAHPHILSAVV